MFFRANRFGQFAATKAFIPSNIKCPSLQLFQIYSMDSSTSPSPTFPSFPDWDEPLTDQELEAIEAVIRSKTASPIQKRNLCNFDDAEDRTKSRRRLPDSIIGLQKSTAFVHDQRLRNLDGIPLLPCPTYRSQENVKTRCPIMNFGGRILYSRTFSDVEKAAAELLKFVESNKRETGQAILGLDIEWRPTFRKGVPPGKAAVMQICGDPSHCYVMHIIHSGIPQNLRSLLEDPTSIKVGVGIGNDSVKVFKDHNISIKDLADLSNLANRKLGDPKNWSLGSLTERLTSKQLEKKQKIRLGNWEATYLSKEQLKYAATDAYVSWFLYQVLKSFPDIADNKSDEQEVVPQT